MEVNIFLNDYVQKLIEYIDIIKSNDIEYQIYIPSIDLIDNKYQAVMSITPNILLDIHTLETLINLPMYNIINFELSLIDQPTQIYFSFDISPSTRLIQLLPDVLTYKILLTLDEEDIINTCHSSPYLEHICLSDNFWRLKFIQDFGHSPPNARENDSMQDVYHASNNLLGFGRNLMGELANVNINHEIKMNNRSFKVKYVACGSYHSLITDIYDNAWAFGSNNDGELGIGKSIGYTLDPIQVTIPSLESKIIPLRAKMISCSSKNSMVIDAKNNVWVFGSNNNGQIGLGDLKDSFLPVKIMINDEPMQALHISAGFNNSFIVDLENNVWASGKNLNSEFNLNFPSSIRSFNQVIINNSPFKAKSIIHGNYYAMAIDMNDNLWLFSYHGIINVSNVHEFYTESGPIKAKFIVPQATNPLFINQEDNLCTLQYYSTGLKMIKVEVNGIPFKAKYAAASMGKFLAIDFDNNVWGYGVNSYGVLGLSKNVISELTPLNIKAHSLAIGDNHSLMISHY